MKTAVGMYGVAVGNAVSKGVRAAGTISGYGLDEAELVAIYEAEGYRIKGPKNTIRKDTINSHIANWIHAERAVRIPGNDKVIFFRLEPELFKALKPELDAFDEKMGTHCLEPWKVPAPPDSNLSFDIYTVKHEDGTVEYVRNTPDILRGMYRCCPLNPCTPLPRTPRGNADTR